MYIFVIKNVYFCYGITELYIFFEQQNIIKSKYYRCDGLSGHHRYTI